MQDSTTGQESATGAFLRGFAMVLAELVRIGRPDMVRKVMAAYDLYYEDFAPVVDEADLCELRGLLPFVKDRGSA